VLAWHDDGAPGLVEARVGRGRVLLWASTLDNVWNDVPLQPVFLPLIHQVALYAAGYVERSPAWAVGEVASLGVEQLGNRQGAVVIQSPAGERVRREITAGVLAIALNEGGFWEVREAGSGGRLIATLAANVPAEETRLEWFDPDDLRLATGAADSTAPGPATADLTPQETERRQGLWWYVLAAVALLLGAETLVANRRPGMVEGRRRREAGMSPMSRNELKQLVAQSWMPESGGLFRSWTGSGHGSGVACAWCAGASA
jgi:hypothetical protein